MRKLLLLFLFHFSLFISSASFAQVHDTLRCVDYGNPYLNNNASKTGYYINNYLEENNGGCGGREPAGVNIAIIDSFICRPVNNCNKDFGQVNTINCQTGIGVCRNRSENYFLYSLTDTSDIKSFSHLMDSIGNGYYILVYSWYVYPYTTLDTCFANSLRRLGSVMINSLNDTVPFIFFCQKGHPSSVAEIQGTKTDTVLTLTTILNCVYDAVNELNDQSSILIYPNPSTGKFTVSFSNAMRNATLKIFNVLGEEVFSEMINGKLQAINTNLNAGIYFLKAEEGIGTIYLQKIIIQ